MIVHLDADAFFASVEQAADPALRGRPVAVGGERRGVIVSASYEARRFGIDSPMPTARARRLCPRLVVLPGDFEKYERFSRLMFSYAYDFTPGVEVTSIDEGYFDLRGSRRGTPHAIAQTLRTAIVQSLKISVSEGIGTSKLVAQIASKLRKPGGLIEVPGGGERAFLWPLANRWLPGVGPQTGAVLDAAGLTHIHQIARTPPDELALFVGAQAPALHRFANGIDPRPVVPDPSAAKSYGAQETFAYDTTDRALLLATLRTMAARLMARVRADGKSIRTVAVKIRYNDMAEAQRSASLGEPTDLEDDLFPLLPVLLDKAWERRVSLRLVAVSFRNVYDGTFSADLALDTAARQHNARRKLAAVLDRLRAEVRPGVILRGDDLWLQHRRDRLRPRKTPEGASSATGFIPSRPRRSFPQ